MSLSTSALGSGDGLQSALYAGVVGHRRLGPTPHEFSQRLALSYLDLDELPAVLGRHPLWSSRPGRPVHYRREDYLGDPGLPLGEAVRALARESGRAGATGPVRVLTQLRTWGWCFNPISLYYCFEPGGARLDCVVASVTNTPWGERHDYVLPAGAEGAVDHTVDKALHVSPFMGMAQTHRFVLAPPGPELRASVENREDDQVVFRAELRLRRRALTRSSMSGLLLRHPAMTWRVSGRIYLEALRLAVAGAPFHPHPARAGTRGRSCPV